MITIDEQNEIMQAVIADYARETAQDADQMWARYEASPWPGGEGEVEFDSVGNALCSDCDYHAACVAWLRARESARAAAAELGARGRAVNSPAQQRAARRNGKKGGRPREQGK